MSEPGIARWVKIACAALLLAVCPVFLAGCTGGKATDPLVSPEKEEPKTAFSPLSATELAEIEPSANGFCGNCHAFPNPAYFTRDAWPREVQRGYDFYFASGRSDLRVPPSSKIKAYYQSLSPDRIPLVSPHALDENARARFEWTSLQVHDDRNPFFAGAGIVHIDFGAVGKGILLSDMRGGGVYWITGGPNSTWANEDCVVSTVAKVRNPSRIVPADMNSDGTLDLLVADLGSFLPADHQSGRVLWLNRNTQESLSFDIVEILTDCGRVADMNPADFDGDGDIDLVVAEFGWHDTGSIIWLERIADELAASSFRPHVVDSRPGALQVPLADIDNDGDMDFVAALAQEFEVVMAYLNDGRGNFTPHRLFDMGDPASGSSSLDLVDLDKDGDLDIVHTNGDSFDSFQVKPYHGIRWLENEGKLVFRPHEIAAMPGVHRAAPSDLDGDGDIDLIAVAFLPPQMSADFQGKQPEAITWFENDGKQSFNRRPLKTGEAIHAAVLVQDVNGDNRPDIIAPTFYDVGSKQSADIEMAISK